MNIEELDVSKLSLEELTTLSDKVWEAQDKLLGIEDVASEVASDFDYNLAASDLSALVPILVVVLFFLFLYAYNTYKMAKKASYEKPWYAFVPVLHGLLRHDIAFGQGVRGWYAAKVALSVTVGTFFANNVLSTLNYNALYQPVDFPINYSMNYSSSNFLLGLLLLVVLYDFYTDYKLYKAFMRPISWFLFGVIFFPVAFLNEFIIAHNRNIRFGFWQRHELDKKLN